jgi:hypothetical protein
MNFHAININADHDNCHSSSPRSKPICFMTTNVNEYTERFIKMATDEMLPSFQTKPTVPSLILPLLF